MREFPVGSVCTIKWTGPNHQHLVGRDVTIIEGLMLRSTGREEYGIEVQGEVKTYLSPHDCLVLRRFPGQLDSWAVDKVKELFKPNSKLAEDLA